MTIHSTPSAIANIGTISWADGAGRDCNPLPATNNGQAEATPATAREGGAGNAATHCAQILAHLKSGRAITHKEAERRFGCARLAARIYDLRQDGHTITRDMIETNNGARVARYRMGAV